MLSSTFGEIAITNGDVADPQDRREALIPCLSEAAAAAPDLTVPARSGKFRHDR
jgi:hypothetical protein